ncbi:MAG: hypothetical protein WC162_04510 [Sphaerochaetaceae bacterium]
MKENLLGQLTGTLSLEDIEGEKRKKKARFDFEYFCNTYLAHYFSSPPAPYQLSIYKIITEHSVSAQVASELRKYTRSEFQKYIKATNNLKGIIDIEPRDHGKSVRMTLAFPLWSLLFEKKKFIALFGATDRDAKEYLENIKHELEENELMINDFGDLKGGTWEANKIVLTNGVALTAKGKGASARGMRHHENRPDLIIIDDLMKSSEADSPEQCGKTYRWIKRTVFNLGKDSFIVMVNTHFNDHDPVTLLEEEVLSGKLKSFIALRFSAQLDDGTPIWEARWTFEDLQKKREEIGSIVYEVEYLSLSSNIEGRIFEPAWFNYFEMKDIDLSNRKITIGVDPNATGSDDAAIAVIAHDQVKKLRDVVSWWSKPFGTRREFVDKLLDLVQIWNPEVVAFEEVAFQKIYKEYILEEALERGLAIPLIGIRPGSVSKKSRVMQYQPYVEAGIMRFNTTLKNTPEMEKLQAFPTKGVNDGIPDALYYAVMATAGPLTPTGAASKKKKDRVKELMRRYIYG